MAYDHTKCLGGHDLSHFHQKLRASGLSQCPYRFAAASWVNNPLDWPDLQYPDVYHYLIETPGVYTRESMKNYRSLEAYNFFVSGFVGTIVHMSTDLSGVLVFRADCKPSFRVTADPHHPWVSIRADGQVIAGHCDCMAGCGSSCSHVAALLFKIEAATRLGYTRKACTDVACKWNSTFVEKVTGDTVAQIKFFKEDVTNKLALTRSKRTKLQPKCTPEQHQSLLQSLKPSKSIGLSLFKETAHLLNCHQPVPEIKKLPYPLGWLYDVKYNALNDTDFQQKCTELHQKVCQLIPEENRFLRDSSSLQADCVVWHQQHVGRVTASVVHDVLHTNALAPATSLVKKICHPHLHTFTSQSVQWGRDHEEDALKAYSAKVSTDHQNAVISKTGLFLLQDHPFLGATPDSICTCDCHPARVVEVKCPYSLRDAGSLQEGAAKGGFCLDEQFNLKRNHQYYSQVQLQMAVFGYVLADFVLWMPKVGAHIVTIERDDGFVTTMIEETVTFWKRHILPELMTHRLKNSVPVVRDSSGGVYCYCRQPDDGSSIMVACDSESCPYGEWFHLSCLKLKRVPKGSWYCKDCRKANRTATRLV